MFVWVYRRKKVSLHLLLTGLIQADMLSVPSFHKHGTNDISKHTSGRQLQLYKCMPQTNSNPMEPDSSQDKKFSEWLPILMH